MNASPSSPAAMDVDSPATATDAPWTNGTPSPSLEAAAFSKVPTSISRDAARVVLNPPTATSSPVYKFWNNFPSNCSDDDEESAADKAWRVIEELLLKGCKALNPNSDYVQRCKERLYDIKKAVAEGSSPFWQKVLDTIMSGKREEFETEEWRAEHCSEYYDSRPGRPSSFSMKDASGVYLFVGFLHGKLAFFRRTIREYVQSSSATPIFEEGGLELMIYHSLKAHLKEGGYFIALPMITIAKEATIQAASDAAAVAALYAAAVLGTWPQEKLFMKARADVGLPRFAAQGGNHKIPFEEPYVVKGSSGSADASVPSTSRPYVQNDVAHALLLEMHVLFARLASTLPLTQFPEEAPPALVTPDVQDLQRLQADLTADIEAFKLQYRQEITTLEKLANVAFAMLDGTLQQTLEASAAHVATTLANAPMLVEPTMNAQARDAVDGRMVIKSGLTILALPSGVELNILSGKADQLLKKRIAGVPQAGP